MGFTIDLQGDENYQTEKKMKWRSPDSFHKPLFFVSASLVNFVPGRRNRTGGGMIAVR